MSIITYTTDWPKGDFYEAALKGHILKKSHGAVVMPVSSSVEPFNIGQAAFILKNAYPYFPDGTIHIIGVNFEVMQKNDYLIVQNYKQFFIGADSGIFSLIFSQPPQKIIKISESNISDDELAAFPEINICANAACEIFNGRLPEALGNTIAEYARKVEFIPTYDDMMILGKVIYIDSYKNAITNIQKELFENVSKNRPFTIFVNSRHDKVTKISKYYYESEDNELLALFNSVGLLEIALCNGKAADLFNLDTNSTIRINFYDNKDSQTYNKR